jgi:hypothetical protein
MPEPGTMPLRFEEQAGGEIVFASVVSENVASDQGSAT